MIARLFNNPGSRNYMFVFLGNLFSAASQWVVMMLLSKLYGTTQMGYYALAMAWILPLFAFFSLQIRNIHVSDQADVYGFNLFFKVRVISIAAFFTTVVAIGYLFYPHIAVLFVLGGLYKSFEMMSDMIHAEFHKRRKNEVYGKMMMLRSVLAITLNFLMFRFIRSYEIALLSLPVAYACSMCIDFSLLRLLQVKINFKTDNRRLRKFMVTGLFTGASLLLVYMMPNIPRFVLEKFRSSYDLGLFSGYLSLIIFTRIFVQALVQNSLPNIAKYYDEHQYGKLIALLKKEAAIICGLGMLQFLIVPFADILFPLLFNKDFTGNKLMLCIIFAGSIFSFLGFVLNNGINAMKILRVQLPVYSVLAVLSFILGFLLIPRYGLNGAAIVFLVVNVCMCLMLFIMIANKLRSRLRDTEYTEPLSSSHLLT